MPIPEVPCTPDHCGQTDVPMIFRLHTPRTCPERCECPDCEAQPYRNRYGCAASAQQCIPEVRPVMARCPGYHRLTDLQCGLIAGHEGQHVATCPPHPAPQRARVAWLETHGHIRRLGRVMTA